MQPQHLLPYLVYAIHLRSPSQKALDHSAVPVARCPHERCVTILRSNHPSHVKFLCSGQTHVLQTDYQKREHRSSRELLFASQGMHFHSHSCKIYPFHSALHPHSPSHKPDRPSTTSSGLALSSPPSVAMLQALFTFPSTHLPPLKPQIPWHTAVAATWYSC